MATKNRQDLKIAVVEDNDADLELLTRALVRAGFTHPSVQLRDGAATIAYFEWLEFAHENPPDIALLDIELPMKNGFKILTWLRTRPVFQHFPVLVLSSAASEQNILRAKSLSALDFLKKEHHFDQVIAALEKFRLAT